MSLARSAAEFLPIPGPRFIPGPVIQAMAAETAVYII